MARHKHEMRGRNEGLGSERKSKEAHGNHERPVREYMDNGREQYELESFYEKAIVTPQMKDYDAMYKGFSRGDTMCPSEMHGEVRNEQMGP